MRVSKAHVKKMTLPLITPYKLSFATVKQISSVFILLELENGDHGIGEATALPARVMRFGRRRDLYSKM